MREREATIAERLIELRKKGPEAMLRKRRPKGRELRHRKELRTTEMYRTPMDDSGHLWREGTRVFECGRYIEYPWYYIEGWDLFFGPHYVMEDTRKRSGNICSLCKAQRDERAELHKWDASCERAAKHHGVVTKYPAALRRDDTPPAAIRWLGADKARRLHAG